MSWKIDPIGALASHEEAWRAISSASGDTSILDFRFVAEAVRHFASGREKIACLRRGDDVVAIALMARVNAFSWASFQPANAPIGLTIVMPGMDIEKLLRSLAAALGPKTSIVSLTQQDPALQPRPANSSHLATLDYILTPSIDVKATFADFMAGRSKNFRHNISRQRNRLKRENISVRLEILTAPAEMARAVADYSALESTSWKADINSAVKMDEPQGRFYVAMLESFATVGEAAVCRFFFDDRLVASDLCLLRGGTLIILKTAYDESRQGYSPAHLMRIDAFVEFFDRWGIKRVEFYGPMTEWHARLTEDARRMYHVNCYRWRGLKFAHALRHRRLGNAGPPEDAASVHG